MTLGVAADNLEFLAEERSRVLKSLSPFVQTSLQELVVLSLSSLSKVELGGYRYINPNRHAHN